MVTERGELLQAHAMAKEELEKKLKAAVLERDRLQTEYDAQTVRAAFSEALVNDLKASSEKVSAECTKAKRATADLQTKLDDMVTERGELLQAHAMAKEDQE
eukprot:Stramenopile-MAST_4_protein_6978